MYADWYAPYKGKGTTPLLPWELKLEIAVCVVPLSYDPWMDRKTRHSLILSFCLVCNQWKKIFIPALYNTIEFTGDNSHLTFSLLQRTICTLEPTRQQLIKEVIIRSSNKSSTVTYKIMALRLPNLEKLELYGFDYSKWHRTFLNQLQSFSKRCAIDLNTTSVEVQWTTFPHWLRFLRSLQPKTCGLNVQPKESLLNGE